MNQALCERIQGLTSLQESGRIAENLERLSGEYRTRLVQASKSTAPVGSNGRTNAYLTRQFRTVLHHGPQLLRCFAPDSDETRVPIDLQEHLKHLATESADSFQALCSAHATRDIALVHAATVDPALHREFGLVPGSREGARRIDELGASLGHGHLDRRQLLLLRHVAHPDMRAFNALRAAANIDRVSPQAKAGAVLAAVLRQFDQAADQIYRLKQARTECTLFKGMVDNSRLRQLREGSPFELPHPSSMTSAKEQSYLGRESRRNGAVKVYDVESVAVNALAIEARVFNPPRTLSECEALALPQRLRVSLITYDEIPRGDGRALPIRRILLSPAPQPAAGLAGDTAQPASR